MMLKTPGATQGSVPSDNAGGVYCHFNTLADYYYAQVHRVISSLYISAHKHQSSVREFTLYYLSMWVKGKTYDGYSSKISYSDVILNEYKKYNLSAWEN